MRRSSRRPFRGPFCPSCLPSLKLKGCSGLEGTLRSLGAVGGGEEACEGTGALAGEGPGVLNLQWTRRLPRSVGLLTGLRTLNLDGCSHLAELPVEIGLLAGLHTLELLWCENLAALPAEVGLLTGLYTLALLRCDRLASLPLEVRHLTGLRTLNLSHSRRTSRPWAWAS